VAAPFGTENSDVDSKVERYESPGHLEDRMIDTELTEVATEELRELLFREPCTFDFFQAVRLLGRLQPERSPVGRFAQPQDEVVRFGTNPTLNFPASSIQSLVERPHGVPFMQLNFIGLTGPLGVLPNYVTELVAGRVREHDRALLEFFDIFNHRIASFFYQAWEKHHFTVPYERDRNDPLTACLFALIGFGTPGLRQRQVVEDESFLFYSGLFAMAPQSAVALESVLGDYFQIPVEVEPFIGVWRTLSEPDQCVFGADVPDSTMLGRGAVVGDEVWDRQSRVRLKLGPLSAERYRDFLPDGSAWEQLRAITRTFCGNDLEFEIQLILRRDDVPPFELRNPEENGLRLGWHTWMKPASGLHRDPGDTILLL
jgi:type VI secretion system protein ImpH